MKSARVFPVFSAVFAVIYFASVYYNLALVSYFPRLKQWFPLVKTGMPPSVGPGMYWYGWLLTSYHGAAVIAALALAVPARWTSGVARVAAWALPIAAIVGIVILLRGWFIH